MTVFTLVSLSIVAVTEQMATGGNSAKRIIRNLRSCHVYKDHPLHVDKKLSNYSLGVIKSTTPVNLDRLEDYYVESLDAKLSLNRYKVTA